MMVKENVGACSESKQCRKREQREKNESERVDKEEDKIEERAVIGINKKIDETVHFFPRKPSRDISIFFMSTLKFLIYIIDLKCVILLSTISCNFYVHRIFHAWHKILFILFYYLRPTNHIHYKSRILIIGDVRISEKPSSR